LFRLPGQIQPIENRQQNLFSGCKADGVKMERTLPARVLVSGADTSAAAARLGVRLLAFWLKRWCIAAAASVNE